MRSLFRFKPKCGIARFKTRLKDPVGWGCSKYLAVCSVCRQPIEKIGYASAPLLFVQSRLDEQVR